MSKRSKVNRIVKDSITEALFSLMAVKIFSDITITEIIKKAGVARISYYRNYESKEDIIKNYIYDFIQNFNENYFLYKTNYDETDYLIMFKLLKLRYKEFRTIYESGLSGLFLNSLNSYFEELNQKNENIEMNKWQFYAANGAFFNVLNKWIMNDMKDDPKEIIESLAFPVNKKRNHNDSF